jgi:putative phage-type endonuclease
VSAAIRIPVVQGTPEWLAARRELVTATDIGVLLGLNPWRSEADLAAEKLGTAPPQESNVRMRIGSALEPLIASEYEAATGRRVRRIHGLWRHPSVTWAGASPDYTVVGERALLETKWSGSRARWADGLPEDVEAQAAWQCFVAGYPACDVAALVGDDLRIFRVEAEDGLARHLVAIAADFRRRLAAGGPFSESLDSVKRRYPADDGTEIAADADTDAAVRALWDLRGRRRSLEDDEAALEAAIKTRMGPATRLTGDGWAVTWKRTKDRAATDWRAVATEALEPLAETERSVLVGRHTTVGEGFRPFRVTWAKEGDAS